MLNSKNTFFNHLAQTTPHPFAIKVDRAQGSFIYDCDGKAYLDLISGIAVSALGHGHPRIKEAINKQTEKHLHVMVYGEFEQAAQNSLAEELLKTLPPTLNSFYFVNSGTEANEAALKLAKRITGRFEIVAFKGGYHGSSHGSLSISSNESKKAAFRPLLPGIRFVELNRATQLANINSETACVILETIQGDAGIRIPDKEYLQALRKRCDEVGALLIFDEIQCGIGRTGKFWAFEHFNVIPDMVTAGKALGAGLPIGCLITSSERMQHFSFNPRLGHISTFGGHPLVCATAAEGLKIITDENLLHSIPAKAKLFKELLQHKQIKELRQTGLLMAVDLNSDEKVKYIVQEGLKRGIILFWFLSTPTAFRISPPLTIKNEEIKSGCKLIIDLLNEL